MTDGIQGVISRKAGIQTAQMEDELGMMDIETGRYYLLDDVGTAIWSLLENPMSADELVESLLEMYDISREICREDVDRFIHVLMEKKVLEIT